MSLLAIGTTQIFSYGTVAMQVLSIFLLIAIVVRKSFPSQLNFFGKNATLFAFIVALATMVGSIFYSGVIGYEPCALCWYQRIFMYPQVFLLGLALVKKDRNIIPYSLLLSAVGAVIAAYHYLVQAGITDNLFCLTGESSVSCSQRYFVSFGYITIPMMSLSAFLLIIFLMISARISNREKHVA